MSPEQPPLPASEEMRASVLKWGTGDSSAGPKIPFQAFLSSLIHIFSFMNELKLNV